MHANIWQLATKPIDEDDYASKSCFYDNTSDFADYVSINNEDVIERDINEWLPRILDGLFTCNGRELTFIGSAEFLTKWNDALKKSVEILDNENILKFPNLYNVECMAKYTHKDVYHRFVVEEYFGSFPETYGDFVTYAYGNLKPGDKLYVGAVIDFHY